MKPEKVEAVLDLLSPELVEAAACVSFPKKRRVLRRIAACLSLVILSVTLYGMTRVLPLQEQRLQLLGKEAPAQVEMQLQERIPVTELSGWVWRDAAGMVNEQICLYAGSIEEASAYLNYPLLRQTKLTGEFQKYDCGPFRTAPYKITVMVDEQGFISCLEVTSVQTLQPNPALRLTLRERQQIYTDRSGSNMLLLSDPEELLLSQWTYRMKDGTQARLQFLESEETAGQLLCRSFFIRDGIVMSEEILFEGEEAVNRQELEQLVCEMLDSYAMVNGMEE